MRSRVARLLRSRATGAAVAQLGQAAGSFALQVVAAWTLGAVGLGLVSLCLGVIVLVTAVSSGMVGDSLVVLDRRNPAIRGALQFWALLLAAVSALVVGSALALTVLTPLQAALCATALVVFQLEELIRRLFMANLAFWKLVVLDTSAVVVSLGILGIWQSMRPLAIEVFFAAVTVGQAIGLVVGVVLLPARERALAPLRGCALRRVAFFGVWRGAQVGINPLLLTVARVVIIASAGSAALGHVEAARILVAPLLLVVQGLGSYLMARYARDGDVPVLPLVRRAGRASMAMIAGVLVAGTMVVSVTPLASPWVTGSGFSIDPITVGGWVLFVVGSASLQPFSSLAVVRGRQRAVFACRITDAAVSLVLLAGLLAARVPVAWAPAALAGGLLVGGVLVRRFALSPLLTDLATPVTEALPTTTAEGRHV